MERLQAKRKKAVLIDVDYIVREGRALVRLLMKGKRFFRLYDAYEPYFYCDAPESAEKEIMGLKVAGKDRQISPTRCERVLMNVLGQEKRIWKVYCQLPSDVPHLSSAMHYPCYEHNIPFGKRYMIDKELAPFMQLTYEREGRFIKRILRKREAAVSLKTMAFDIETYNPVGMPRPDKDEIILISYKVGSQQAKVLSSRKIARDFVVACKDERQMIEKFLEAVRENDVEVLFGYNDTVFDLPYLKARADSNGLVFAIGRDGKPFRIRKHGIRDVAEIAGRIHIDLYPVVRFMGLIGAFKISKYSLENAYEELTGKRKLMVGKLDIWRMWDGDAKMMAELADYSRFDAVATMEIGEMLLPMQIEMSRVARLPLFDTANATAGQLVESILMHKSRQEGRIIPNKPDDTLASQRELGPIKGAFVKIPQPGIYENLVVFDFRGLYPSIITSHNIDPYTIDPPPSVPDSDCYLCPNGHRFRKKPRGLIPSVLEEIIKMRAEMKARLKTLEKDSPEYEMVFARQQSLKILANSYYGYLAYPRSRWYSRECGESVTAWGRYFIQDTIDKAEKAGFTVLYGDTDSIFLLLRGRDGGLKTKQDALEFMRRINQELPGDMELELEGFYPRGVFVTKKVGAAGSEETGAKKKYALIGEDGRIKIRGFELVRRDWSNIAKQAQRKVLEAILKDGSKEKAVRVVKEIISLLKEGKAPLEDLIIYTQIRKDPKKYDVTSPELSAAKKAIAAGMRIERGSMIGYVITKSGGSISEKAQLAELARDYDAQYYIEKQVLPAVLKILKELGYSENDLKFKGEQKGLDSFF
ncbi:MAG: DNA-directed DNA polymerase [Candidatus Micrarchaeota archaeon]|nr:DNA-directed DNA polymerase [Candidatus Micrarchaeota archaeon]